MKWLQLTLDNLYNQQCLLFFNAVISCYIIYYLFEVVKKPLIATSPDGDFRRFVEKCMPVLNEKFWPTAWCIESRFQTIIASYVRSWLFTYVPYQREILVLKDGGEICLDTLEPKEGYPTSGPTIIVMPGITGTSDADYSKGFVLAAKEAGIRVVVYTQRGLGIPCKTSRTYCGTNYEDFIEVIDYLRRKYEGTQLGAVGISMGGVILGKYLTTHGTKGTPLSCAMIISVPWDVHLMSHSLENSFINLQINKHLVTCILDILGNIRHLLEPDRYDVEQIFKCKTLREFDTCYTSKQFDYQSVEDYYSDSSLHNDIHKTTIPLLCLSSADDPFQPIHGIPIDAANKQDNLCIVVTSRGGHIGFMDGIIPTPHQYMFRIFSQYFKSMLLEGGLSHFSNVKNNSTQSNMYVS